MMNLVLTCWESWGNMILSLERNQPYLGRAPFLLLWGKFILEQGYGHFWNNWLAINEIYITCIIYIPKVPNMIWYTYEYKYIYTYSQIYNKAFYDIYIYIYTHIHIYIYIFPKFLRSSTIFWSRYKAFALPQVLIVEPAPNPSALQQQAAQVAQEQLDEIP